MSSMDWWPNADIDEVSSSQEEYVNNQFLDVKDNKHFDWDNLEVPLPIKQSNLQKRESVVPMMYTTSTSTNQIL